jgi:hypothetical protein
VEAGLKPLSGRSLEAADRRKDETSISGLLVRDYQ